jgi:hypothetical protein
MEHFVGFDLAQMTLVVSVERDLEGLGLGFEAGTVVSLHMDDIHVMSKYSVKRKE